MLSERLTGGGCLNAVSPNGSGLLCTGLWLFCGCGGDTVDVPFIIGRDLKAPKSKGSNDLVGRLFSTDGGFGLKQIV